ncbi:hypothetical protein CBER1_09689 [Cercospora berteroae]|uniref:Uncharacterized protein n=1 Tax=Cercospora berteroae TaxID=357750 RepID=A0A2S6BWS7_9PEZI|nr:hypothetical protein CBER1_09689 [Cercospora berteroae]
MPTLPDHSHCNKYLRILECLQVLACTDDELLLLKDAVLSIGMRPDFDGQSLFDQDLRKFDSFGRHRQALWAEVENSDPLFAELLSGTRQECGSATWHTYISKVKTAIIHKVMKPIRNRRSRTTRARLTSEKRSSTSEVIDLDDDTEEEDEEMTGVSTTLEEETDERPGKRAKLSFRIPDTPETSSFASWNTTPLRKSVGPPVENEEMSDDHQGPSNEHLPCHDQSSEEVAGGFANKMAQLVKQHLDQRTAELDATFEARVAAQVVTERAGIAEKRNKIAQERESLARLVEEQVQQRVSEEKQELESVIMGEAEAQVAAERNEIGLLIERQVQIRLPEERITWEEAVAKQLKSLF